MRRLLLFVGCLLLLVPFTAVGQDEVADLEAALALIPGTDVMIEYSDEGRAQLEAAITAFRTALGIPEDLDESNEDRVDELAIDLELKDLVNKLSQCYYTLADAFLGGEDDEIETFLKGKHWGLKSLRMNPDFVALEKEKEFIEAVKAENDIAALYWANANWLRVAEADKLTAIRAGAPGKTVNMAKRTLELDPTYICFGPYRTLGAFYSGLPTDLFSRAIGWGQDLPKALSYFCYIVDEPAYCADCDGCTFDPVCNEYFESRTFFVEFYLMEKELWEDAARVLTSVLDEPIGDKYPLYNAISQEKAQAFLEEVNKHL